MQPLRRPRKASKVDLLSSCFQLLQNRRFELQPNVNPLKLKKKSTLLPLPKVPKLLARSSLKLQLKSLLPRKLRLLR
jgi:hypothetical protein